MVVYLQSWFWLLVNLCCLFLKLNWWMWEWWEWWMGWRLWTDLVCVCLCNMENSTESVTFALSKTTVQWGSLEVEDEVDGATSGAMNTGSSWPQKWYWQKTKLDRWRGRPLAWRIFTWERGDEEMHSPMQIMLTSTTTSHCGFCWLEVAEQTFNHTEDSCVF